MRILLAGCRDYLLTKSDDVLASALRRRGVETVASPWDEIHADRLEKGDLVCIRSTWDYFLGRAEEFRRWIESFSRNPERLVNPPDTALWNLDKIYLRELHAAGVPIPETRWIESVEDGALGATLKDAGWDLAVVKPRVAGGGHGTYRVGPDTKLTDKERVPAYASGALVQEYVTEIESRGEISLMYLAGKFSHAIVKRTSSGDFRVQSQFGGTIERIEAGPPLREFGAEVLRRAARPWVYARVDLVERATGPVLMELEILEPDLFFTQEPRAAEVLAGELIALAGR
ncbi:MAG TPA: hypothetical protein VFP58_10530 [Candidatus Eisenbacteria bacterium]|nr:hypothetical protein [Candidatus Eisenbacteria bacterium]